ncbi:MULTISPECIES: hypothetical protein [unclassified Shewanella]|uniref:hypothetical protein n=1 Tax=unclassified Shewanella TaxID=196818 RepID=UPI000C32D041|nr:MULTISPECIES: hypothetical protein [unclassified Shewanella]PKG75753.1 hypothetical protein CXF86_05945 [Shewanella sp. GutCb]
MCLIVPIKISAPATINECINDPMDDRHIWAATQPQLKETTSVSNTSSQERTKPTNRLRIINQTQELKVESLQKPQIEPIPLTKEIAPCCFTNLLLHFNKLDVSAVSALKRSGRVNQ